MKNWIKITNKNMPTKNVLVTNNLFAKHKNGDMSHVWIAETGVKKKGENFFCYTNLPSNDTIEHLTHYCEIPQP